MVCGSAAFIILVMGGVSAYTPPVLVMASLSSIVIPGIFAFLTIFLIIARLFVRAAQWVMLHVFDVASNPEKSPYTYASSLLGLLILLFKLAQELATAAINA